MKVLQDHANPLSNVVTPDLVDVDTIEEDHVVVEVVEANQQPNDGALARSGWPNDCQLLAGGNPERHVFEHVFVAIVTEMNVTELDLTLQSLRQLRRMLRLVQLLVPIECLEDPLSRGHRTEQNVELLAEHHDRVDHHVDELREHHQGTQRDLLLHDFSTPVPNDSSDGDTGKAGVEGFVDHLVVDGAEFLLTVILIQFFVLIDVHGFPPGKLDDVDAGEVFLHVLVERRHRVTNQAEYASHQSTENIGAYGGNG